MRGIYCPKRCPHLKITEKAYCEQEDSVFVKFELQSAFVDFIDDDGNGYNIKVAVYSPQVCVCGPVSIEKIINERRLIVNEL